MVRGGPRTVAVGPRPLLRPFIVATILVASVILAVGVVRQGPEIVDHAAELLLWVAVDAAIGLAAVTFVSGAELGLDAPLLIAAAIIFGPISAGLIAVFGYVDRREWRHAVSFERAMFNRSQIALSVVAGGAAFHLIGNTSHIPRFLLGALVAVAVDMIVNWALVIIVRMLHQGLSPRYAIAGSYTGRLGEFVLGYGTFSLLSAAMAQAYGTAGPWTLATFGLVAVLGRRTFETTQSLSLAETALKRKDEELLKISHRLAEERRDERLAVAAGIHDEVLPPLSKVHLLGQVVRQDLAAGRLLDLDVDVPELVRATEIASESMRTLIGNLRSSPIGAHGLRGTIQLLCGQLAAESGVFIVPDIDEVDAPPAIQLLAYQVTREALRNAVKYARASRIDVSVKIADDSILRIVIGDDGRGFVPGLVDRSKHFGLQLLRDRLELFGGAVVVDSTPGSGTRVAARIPVPPGTD
jgi:signal transduction histidine kinase